MSFNGDNFIIYALIDILLFSSLILIRRTEQRIKIHVPQMVEDKIKMKHRNC